MYREIRKKMIILGNRRPFTKEVSSLVRYMQKRDWVFLNMKLEGSQITMADLEKVLKEEALVNMPIEDYLLIRQLEQLFNQMFSWAAKGRALSKEMIGTMYELCSSQKPVFRKSTPVVLQWSFTPILPQDIAGKIDEMLAKSLEETFDPFLQATSLHNDFLRIYPFADHNGIVARGIMYYFLLCKGMPLASMELKEEEYNSILYMELNKGWDKSQLYEYLVKGTLDTLKIIDNLTKQ